MEENAIKRVEMSFSNEKERIKQMIKEWKEFNLEGQRNKMDNKAKQFTEESEASKQSKKKLSEETRNFSKQSTFVKQLFAQITPPLPPNMTESLQQLLKQFGVLIKQYQSEINVLSQRSLSSHSYFFELYKLLVHLTDPLEALELLLVKLEGEEKESSLQIENQQLRQQLLHFEKDFGELQNREVTIRKLQEQCKQYEREEERKVEERVREKLGGEVEREVLPLLNQLSEYKDSNSLLLSRLSQLKQELSQLSHSHNSSQSQLLLLNQKYLSLQEAHSSKSHLLLSQIDSLQHEKLLLNLQLKQAHETLSSLQQHHPQPQGEGGGEGREKDCGANESGVGVASGREKELESQVEGEVFLV